MSLRVSALALILLNLAVFAQVTAFEFVHFDDDLYVTDNPHVRAGLSLSGIKYAFSSEPAPMSNPLTLVSHMLDVEIYGVRARGHHLTNLLLHIANSLLLLAVLHRMTAKTGASFFVAALFAIHPLHVESVAWISDRKDLLSGLFWLAALWLYANYAANANAKNMIALSAVYTLSLLAKPMAVTLPFLLLLLDWWPLGRLSVRSDLLPRLREKWPLFALSALACLGTWYLQHTGGATAGLDHFTLQERVQNAMAAYGIYMRQTLWPFGLGIYYPAPPNGATAFQAFFGAAVLAGLVTIAWLTRRSMPWVGVGVLWFIGMLIPVIGFVQVGNQLHADRYTYLPIIGLFVAGCFTVRKLVSGVNRSASLRAAVTASALALVAALAVRAYDQTTLWKNSESLFKHTIEVAGESLMMRNNLGNYYLEHGWLEDAEKQYRLAEQLRPGHLLPSFNLARLDVLLGRNEDAIRRLEPLAQRYPYDHAVRLVLAEALLRTGDPQAAMLQAEAAQALRPLDPAARILLGFSLEHQGRPDDARAIFLQAVEDFPEYTNVHVTLANFLAGRGEIEEAFRYYARAMELSPRDASIPYNLGAALERAGDRPGAIRAYRNALELNSNLVEAQDRLKFLEDEPPVSN